MRARKIGYADALSLARESRVLIHPNPGFEAQLRIWEFCGYDVWAEDGGNRKPKKAYEAFLRQRDELAGRGWEAVMRERVKGMAGLAARVGLGGSREERLRAVLVGAGMDQERIRVKQTEGRERVL